MQYVIPADGVFNIRRCNVTCEKKHKLAEKMEYAIFAGVMYLAVYTGKYCIHRRLEYNAIFAGVSSIWRCIPVYQYTSAGIHRIVDQPDL